VAYKSLRFLLVFLLALLMIETGFQRGKYVINLTGNGQPLLLPRWRSVPEDFPASLNVFVYFLQNPKWGSTLLYTLIFMGFSALMIGLVFRRWEYMKITCLAYLGLSGLGFVLVLLFNLLGLSETGYFIGQNLKEIASSPFLVMMLIPAFLLHQRMEGR
jgi:hypothetical protein